MAVSPAAHAHHVSGEFTPAHQPTNPYPLATAVSCTGAGEEGMGAPGGVNITLGVAPQKNARAHGEVQRHVLWKAKGQDFGVMIVPSGFDERYLVELCSRRRRRGARGVGREGSQGCPGLISCRIRTPSNIPDRWERSTWSSVPASGRAWPPGGRRCLSIVAPAAHLWHHRVRRAQHITQVCVMTILTGASRRCGRH